MTSATSLAAYAHLVSKGLLSERQVKAWAALEAWGPMTAAELDQQAGTRGLWKRLSELYSLGLVRKRDARLCRVTHKAATVWEHVPGEPPHPYRQPPPRPVYYLVITAVGRVMFAGADKAEADRVAGAHEAEVVKAREVKRYIPKM